MDLVVARRQPGRHRLLPHVRGQRAEADPAPVGELRVRRRGGWRRRACSSSRTRTRARTATSRACSASYVRDEKLIPLEEAIRRLTTLPAANLKLAAPRLAGAGLFRRRGGVRSREGCGSRHVRAPAPVRDRHGARVRERRAGAARTASTPGPSRGGWCGGRATGAVTRVKCREASGQPPHCHSSPADRDRPAPAHPAPAWDGGPAAALRPSRRGRARRR